MRACSEFAHVFPVREGAVRLGDICLCELTLANRQIEVAGSSQAVAFPVEMGVASSLRARHLLPPVPNHGAALICRGEWVA